MYTLRKGKSEDAGRIGALFLEMLQAIYPGKAVQGYPDGALDRFFAGGSDWVCVAEAEGEVFAFLSVEEHHDAADYFYLDDCCVTEAWRGRGIGTAMFAQAERVAAERGIPLLVLHVEGSNERAHALYHRLGFVDDEVQGSRVRMLKTVDEKQA